MSRPRITSSSPPTDASSQSTGFGLPPPWFEVAVTAALGLVIVLVPLLTLRPDTEPDRQETGIRTTAGSLVTVPEAPKGEVRNIRRSLTKFVDGLYVLAFRPEQLASKDTPIELPAAPQRRIARLFDPQARAVLSGKPGVFDLGALNVQRGRLTFKGVATLDGNRATVAFLHLNFSAVADAGGEEPDVDVRQRGTLLLHRTAQGWKVAGFDLRLRTAPAPTPSPSDTDGR